MDMKNTPHTRTPRLLLSLVLTVMLAGCGGGGGGGDVDDDGGGGSGTGEGNVPIFWMKFGAPSLALANSIRQTPDNGFVAAGLRAQEGSNAYDLFLVKTTDKGSSLWQKSYGSSANTITRANCVRPATGGGYIVAGLFQDASQQRSFFLLRTDDDGNALAGWPRTYSNASLDGAYAVCESTDASGSPDGFVFTGSTHLQQFCLIKTDLDGNVLWQKTFSGFTPGWDVGLSLERNPDRGFTVAGSDGGPPNSVWVVRTDAQGNALSGWPRRYGTGCANSVRITPDGGFILAGNSVGMYDDGDVLVVKVDSAGTETWRKTFGGTADDVGSSVDLTPDGGYLVAGYTESYSLYNDYDFLMREVYLIRLDGAGNTLWHKVKGIAPDSVETAADVQVLQDGSFVIAGAAGGSFLMARMDENGDTVGLGDDELNLTNPTSLTITLANAHIVAGRTLSLLNILSQAGAFGLDLLLAVQDDPSLNDGDTLSVTPAPDSLSAGQSYDVILDAFQTGDAGDLTTLGGSFTITIDSLTGALEDGGTYTTGITLSSIDMEQTDDVGTTHLAGSVGVSRQASPGSVVETVQNTPSDSFRTSSDSIDVTATAYSLSVASSQGGGFTLGAAGEEMVFDIEHMEGSLTMTVLSPVQGADPLSLTGGSVMIEAEDLSSVTLKFRTGGTVDLDVDADGDGTVDSTLSIPLDELD